ARARRVPRFRRPPRAAGEAPGRRSTRRSLVQSIRYSARRFAEVLGLSPQQLTEAETRGALARLRAEAPQRTAYTLDDLARARAALGRQPARRPMRRQLFLNFKGGTGKTSVSTSYAFRLAEMGHRVLVIDLDSQGHASKCL